jgi:hypothetical protein
VRLRESGWNVEPYPVTRDHMLKVFTRNVEGVAFELQIGETDDSDPLPVIVIWSCNEFDQGRPEENARGVSYGRNHIATL